LFLKRGKERRDRSGKNTKLIVKLMWFQRGQISVCQVIIGLLWNRSLRKNDQAVTRTKLSSSFSIPVMRSDEGGRGASFSCSRGGGREIFESAWSFFGELASVEVDCYQIGERSDSWPWCEKVSPRVQPLEGDLRKPLLQPLDSPRTQPHWPGARGNQEGKDHENHHAGSNTDTEPWTKKWTKCKLSQPSWW
jgi:hypothetical protein